MYKPLPRRTSSARGATADKNGKAQGAAKAKAKAKAKPTAKAKAAPAPWRKPQGGTGSSTEPRSAYQLLPEAAARAATDDVAYAEEHLRLLEAMGRADKLPEARRELAEARRRQQERLPPQERLQLLQAELLEAEEELDRRERAIVHTEFELRRLEDQLTEQREAVVDGKARVDRLNQKIEMTELQVPPGAQAAETEEATAEALNRHLLQAQSILNQMQGSDRTEETKAEIIHHLQALQTKGEEAALARRQREAQEAADAEMARNLQQEEHNQLHRAEDAGDGEWQEPKKPRKGKGKGTTGPTASATELPFMRAHEIGPLATATRGQTSPAPAATGNRAASEPRSGRGRQERHRSPRRQAGTPAQAASDAAGSLGPAAAGGAASPRDSGGAAASNQRGGPTGAQPATGR